MWGSCRSVLPCSAVGGLSGKLDWSHYVSFLGCQIWNGSVQGPRPKVLAHETNLEFKRRACGVLHYILFIGKEIHNLLSMWPKSNGINVLNTVWADLQLEQLLNRCDFIWCNSARLQHIISQSISLLRRRHLPSHYFSSASREKRQDKEGTHQTGRLPLPLF